MPPPGARSMLTPKAGSVTSRDPAKSARGWTSQGGGRRMAGDTLQGRVLRGHGDERFPTPTDHGPNGRSDGPASATTAPQGGNARMKTDRPATAPPNGDASSGVPRRPSLLSGLLRSARPKQWAKNVLVFAAPGAAGVLTQRTVLLHALAAFGIFCVAASGTYFLNDAMDIEADRLHPRKQHRPIAAGVVSVGLAFTIGIVLLLASVGAAYALAGWHLCLVIGIYAALQPLYTVWLKHLAVIDLAAVASGFVLRAI